MFGIERSRIDLLWELIKAHFKIKYNNSLLGFLWVFLKPFFLFLIMYVVWTRFADASTIDKYPLYLLSGLIIYTLFSDGVTLGTKTLLDGAAIILHINYPRQIHIIVIVVMSLINYGISLVIFLLFGLVQGGLTIDLLAWLYFLFVSVILTMSVTAISFVMSVALIWLRDVENIMELVMRLLFFATPIFYSVNGSQFSNDDIAGRLVAGNPLGIIINAGRNALVYGQIHDLPLMLVYFGLALVALWLSWLFFSRQVITIAEHF